MDEMMSMEEIGLHLMQSNLTCRADRGKIGFFWKRQHVVARNLPEKEKLSGSTWDFWHKFLPTYT